ncbi:hypothetical protein B7993_13020 [Fibrobacter sp. UWH3]|nr:hypothetical protein B7993_13020 [Fibrobacter sp. UWH3]OWV06335.1 hypothetical protein B7992_14945 [Fibrobacter sp. UWH1]
MVWSKQVVNQVEKLKDERPGAVPGENQNQKIGPNDVGKKRLNKPVSEYCQIKKKDFKHV